MPESALATAAGLLAGYDPGAFYDELLRADDGPGEATARILRRIDQIDFATLRGRARDAENELFNLGITFLVYAQNQAIDRILPFDVIPRVITATEWQHLEAGVQQRTAALNLFLADLYDGQKALKDGIVPAELVLGNSNYQPAMAGLKVPHGAYVNILGVDLIRDEAGIFRVLEDNCRVPSGVSYVIENRHLMQRAFSDLIDDIGVRGVDDYGGRLHQMLAEIAPPAVPDPQVALLSPGPYNSAYFEHVFLARELGVPLVEGRDLVVEDDRVYMRTTNGLAPVDCLYRRIDDAFLDPKTFRADSVLGVPGLFDAYRKGNVGLANAVGTGVADDKAVYTYLPRLIRYYLDQDPILQSVPTHICREPEGLRYTLDHLAELVVKPVGEAGGYGITIGPKATAEQLAECRRKLLDDPGNYISQPMISLSVCPTVTDAGVEPRHVDLRPFALTGRSTWVLPGGLTRVALRRGALVVNSSQGGGSKDTWVLS